MQKALLYFVLLLYLEKQSHLIIFLITHTSPLGVPSKKSHPELLNFFLARKCSKNIEDMLELRGKVNKVWGWLLTFLFAQNTKWWSVNDDIIPSVTHIMRKNGRGRVGVGCKFLYIFFYMTIFYTAVTAAALHRGVNFCHKRIFTS